MSYLAGYHQLISQIDSTLCLPDIERILLPEDLSSAAEIKDNFAFVLLNDGSVGPFYSCLGQTRQWLANNARKIAGKSATHIAAQLDGVNIPRSALALGAFNAMSQHVMRRAGFDPSAIPRGSNADLPDTHIGMVGFFGPLIDRYLAQGKRVTIIEQQPERVPAELGLPVFTSPAPLAECDYILCTASTLINNTLESIIAAAGDPAKINIIGPSASGLPDLLFDLGIHSTGGLVIDRPDELEIAMAAGESWGDYGRKYQLTKPDYPGISRLLERITDA